MKHKVDDEVRDLNKVHREIMQEEQRIKQLMEIKERNKFFNVNIQSQSKFNNALAHDYKQKTKNIKEVMDNGEGIEDDRDNQIKYETDPNVI